MNSKSIVQQMIVSAVIVLAMAGCDGASDAPTVTSTPILPSPTVTTPKAEPTLSGKYDLGGFTLFIECIGEGSPTVVLDSGLGQTRLEWEDVLALMAVDTPTRVCVYDHRGIGMSYSRLTEPRSSQVMVDELRALLDAADIPSPYILAGHSAGGLNVWLFASQYPDEVAGVIMVDSSHPDQSSRELDAMEPFMEGEYADFARELASVPDPMGSPEHWDLDASFEEVRAAGPFGDIPLVVLTHDIHNTELQLALFRRYIRFDFPAELVEALEETWLPLQEELTELSTNSVHIIVENSTHMIPWERPDAVVDAILQVMEMAETGAPQ